MILGKGGENFYFYILSTLYKAVVAANTLAVRLRMDNLAFKPVISK